MNLEKLAHYGPVTSIKIFQQHILVGYGPILKIFTISEKSLILVHEKQVFRRNKIHHISVDKTGSKIAACGARSFIIVDLAKLVQGKEGNIQEKSINEWITCVEFLNPDVLLLLNSHNTVYEIDISNEAQKFLTRRKVDSHEKSILYSGSIRVLDEQNVLIAAGTVMHGVIVWSLNQAQVLHNFTDHEGSIFGVQIDAKGNYLTSCSDDRSVKLYDLNQAKLLASGWGHGSRIWSLHFFKDISKCIKILSTGEDCSARIWKYTPGLAQLEQEEQSFEDIHSGKHVWSSDIDDVNNKLLVTGGADGRIRLHDLSESMRNEQYPLKLLTEHTGVLLKKNEIIKQFYELLHLDVLVVLTSVGNIFTLNQKTRKFHYVKLDTNETESFNNFGIMRGFDEINTIAISTRSGDILILQFSSHGEPPRKEWIHNELMGLNKVSNFLHFHDTGSEVFYLLTDCPNPKIPIRLRVFSITKGDFRLEKTLQIYQPDQVFTTTCFTIDSKNNWLILGSRYVTIAIYDLNTSQDKIVLSDLFKKVVSGDSITSVSIVSSDKCSCRVLVTVRDGMYFVAKLYRQNEAIESKVLHQNKFSRGSIEGGFFKEGDMFLYGFRSTYFFIWNENKQLETYKKFCGGSHRQWNLYRYSDSDVSLKFIYINKSSLTVSCLRNRFSKEGLVIGGSHGREIRSVAVCESESSKNHKLVMTASEDSTVKLSILSSDSSIDNVWTLNKHVSGLQTTKFLNSIYAASSAANEEFYIWKILEDINGSLYVTDFATPKLNSDVHDLRIMDFASLEVPNGFIIAAVYSNSSIVIWRFDTTSRSFEVLVDDFYSTVCILNVDFLILAGKQLLVIGATDGNITLWDVSQIFSNQQSNKLGKPVLRQNLHQDSIKCFVAIQAEDYYNIITGGDDNALILCTLSVKNDSYSLDVDSFIENAASSTITSISSLGDSSIAVTSVDQILRIWTYKSGVLEVLDSSYTTIADTGCSASTLMNGRSLLIVGGAGLSVWGI